MSERGAVYDARQEAKALIALYRAQAEKIQVVNIDGYVLPIGLEPNAEIRVMADGAYVQMSLWIPLVVTKERNP